MEQNIHIKAYHKYAPKSAPSGLEMIFFCLRIMFSLYKEFKSNSNVITLVYFVVFRQWEESFFEIRRKAYEFPAHRSITGFIYHTEI